jgi:hypothetical protein
VVSTGAAGAAAGVVSGAGAGGVGGGEEIVVGGGGTVVAGVPDGISAVGEPGSDVGGDDVGATPAATASEAAAKEAERRRGRLGRNTTWVHRHRPVATGAVACIARDPRPRSAP